MKKKSDSHFYFQKNIIKLQSHKIFLILKLFRVVFVLFEFFFLFFGNKKKLDTIEVTNRVNKCLGKSDKILTVFSFIYIQVMQVFVTSNYIDFMTSSHRLVHSARFICMINMHIQLFLCPQHGIFYLIICYYGVYVLFPFFYLVATLNYMYLVP